MVGVPWELMKWPPRDIYVRTRKPRPDFMSELQGRESLKSLWQTKCPANCTKLREGLWLPSDRTMVIRRESDITQIVAIAPGRAITQGSEIERRGVVGIELYIDRHNRCLT